MSVGDQSLTFSSPSSEHQSQFSRVLKRLMRSTNARVGFALVVAFLAIAILAPIVDPYDARRDLNLKERLSPPSIEHIFGTDDLGRDVARRVVHGARVSLQVAILAVGQITKAALIDDADHVVVGSIMGMTLSADHRVVDGAVGAEFLARLINILEGPYQLLTQGI